LGVTAPWSRTLVAVILVAAPVLTVGLEAALAAAGRPASSAACALCGACHFSPGAARSRRSLVRPELRLLAPARPVNLPHSYHMKLAEGASARRARRLTVGRGDLNDVVRMLQRDGNPTPPGEAATNRRGQRCAMSTPALPRIAQVTELLDPPRRRQ